MKQRHILQLELDERMMGVLFREGATVRCMCGVPADAVLLGVNADFRSRRFVAQFEHPSFPPCDAGKVAQSRFLAYEVIDSPWPADVAFDYVSAERASVRVRTKAKE